MSASSEIATGSIAAGVAASVAQFLTANPAETELLNRRLRDSLREGGLAHGHNDEAHAAVGSEWRLDPSPLVIPASEWSVIEAAVRQRARFANALLDDIYGEQRLLKNKILPPELVLADPFFRRPCKGVELGGRPRATVLRFDLVRGASGWTFVQTYSNTPLGLFLAAQNRRLMAQEADSLYARLPPFHSVSDMPLTLVESLRALAPVTPVPPSVVVLSSGPGDPYYSEHSFLARKMGVPLAQGDDLIVLDNRVYFKSIEGLEPVDVIYRRLHDGHIDPVVFPTDRDLAGIAGLLGCLRAGTVAVANSIGAGFLENRGLKSYQVRMMRALLGEKPILPSLTTYFCGDPDQLAHALDAGSSLDFRPVHDSLPRHPIIGNSLRRLSGSERRALLRKHPALFVAQDHIQPATHTSLIDGTPVERPLRLSVFAIVAPGGISVLRGGLGVLGPAEGESSAGVQQLDPSLEAEDPARTAAAAETGETSALGAFPLAIGLSCDVVVLRAPDEVEPPEQEPPGTRPRALVLGSRAAENLFWLGRYTERAENTARMVALMSDIGLEDLAASERERWFPRWRGFLEATGHSLHRDYTSPDQVDLAAHHLALSRSNPSSILTSAELIRENARRSRDFLSPECWRIVSRLRDGLARLAAQGTPRRERMHADTDAAIDQTLLLLPSLHGTIDRTMPVDAGTRFLRAGARLERCITTAAALRLAFKDVEEMALPPHTSHPHLGATVRLLVSQDAFRRAYQAPATPQLVAEFFLRNRESPQSIEHCLAFVIEQLEQVGGDLAFPDSPPRLAARHLRFVQDIPIERALAGESDRPLSDWIEELLTKLFSLSDAMGDFYMNHQARFCA